MPRKKRSPSRWRCAKPCTTARPPRWSRRTARSGAACWPRSGAGILRPRIPAATRLPKRRPEFLPGSPPKPRSMALRRSRCWRCSNIRCCGSTWRHRTRARGRHARARDPARAASARRNARPGPRAQDISREQRQLASLRPAPRIDRCRARRRCRSRRPARPLRSSRWKASATHAAAQRACRAPSRRVGRAVAARRRQRSLSPAPTAQSSPTRSTNWRRAKPRPACSSRRPTMSNCLPRLWPAASCAGRQPGLRVRILGPLEARLTESDRVVLGGLVEGTWPPESRTDAWLSRPMRLNLGLDLPERRIGLSAHDFAQLLGARDVILTHAAKIAGTPTVPSRFIQRLAAVAGERWPDALERGETYLAWARELDRPEAIDRPAPQPAPKPPRAARPAKPFGDRDRALAARPLYDLCQAHPAAHAARSDRRRTRRRRARHVHPQCHRRIHENLRRQAAGRSGTRAHRTGTAAFRRAERFSRGARVLVAALRAHRALVRALGDARAAPASPPSSRRFAARSISRSATARSSCPALPTASSATPKAATSSSTTRPARREPKSRCAPDWRRSSPLKPRCCARASSRTFRPARRSPSSAMCCSKAASRPANHKPLEIQGRHAGQSRRPRAGKAHRARQALRRCRPALSLAGASDVDDPLRRLRPSRPRQGMVEHRRRGRRFRRRRMRTPGIIPDSVRELQRARFRTRTYRRGSPPMPAPARPTCWCSA